ncbi:Transcriptional regulatory protein sin3 [Rhizophlyctis rosea]|nr:Transcriptional regulatory protein sin3 [Rhizophlyctis rosea]
MQQSSGGPTSTPVTTSVPSTPSTPIHSSASSIPSNLAVAEAAASAVSQYRPLNVKDALSYLDQVKIQFSDQPEVYNRFLDIMKDFKSQSIAITSNQIDTPGVIDRVSSLFRGHPNLIMGFNTFLPPGYKIEPTNNPNDPVRVTTPRDHPPYVHHPPPPLAAPSSITDVAGQSAAALSAANTMAGYFGTPGYGSSSGLPSISSISSHGGSNTPQNQYSNAAALGASSIISSMHAHGQQGGRGANGEGSTRRAPVEFNHAINYVNKIKNRFSTEPETYKQFLEILQTYQKEQKPIHDVYAQVQILFKGAPDLLDEFKQFLPDNSGNQGNGGAGSMPRPGLLGGVGSMGNGMAGDAYPSGNKRPSSAGTPGASSSSNAPGGKKQQKRPAPGGSISGGMLGSNGGASQSTNGSAVSLAQPPKKKAKVAKVDKPGNIEELEFFDKCKRLINNKAVYNEFLKVLNLFSQEIIEARVLIQRVEPFLAKAPELFEWFKRFVKYQEEDFIYNIPVERPHLNIDQCKQAGHSYRKLPSTYPRPPCKGRDDLCHEVLNDDFISHPMYVSESGFLSHKKTVYEEALHKCEEERYEFDLNIEANLHTIALLEPIAKRIQGMTPDERNRFKLEPGLGGTSKSIYQRAIKKIYDKERGLEIIEALHNSPAVAVPVVLKRLKQKDEEWKRAQRDWNKVWREIDAKNYYKALDHIGISFKQSDKKATAPKALIAEIEAIYKEQREKPSKLANRYQFDFSFKDQEVFRDVMRLIRLNIKALGLGDEEEGRLKSHAYSFVQTFFVLDGLMGGYESDSEFSEGGNDTESDLEEEVGGAGVVGRPRVRVNSLRRNVLLRGSGAGGVNGRGVLRRGSGGSGMKRSKLSGSADVMETDEDDVGGDGDTESIGDFGVGSRGGTPDVGTPGSRGSEAVKEGSLEGVVVGGGEGGEDGALGPLVGGRKEGGQQQQQLSRTRAKRSTYTFYANATIYVFFRLFQIAYSRLLKMKELSRELSDNPPRAEKLNTVAVELGLQKADAPTKPEIRDRYKDLLSTIEEFLTQEIEPAEFEEKTRDLFGTSAYLVFTIDKHVQNIVKQLQTIYSDSTSSKLLTLYHNDRSQVITSSRQEGAYRYTAESVLDEEPMFRLEYFVPENVLTIQFFSKDDYLGDHSISREEKWSHYIDSFVQLPATDIVRGGGPNHREPFLRRCLPVEGGGHTTAVGEVVSRSGLELKICQNSYKMFFVDGSEDWFWRRGVGGEGKGEGVEGRRRGKFRVWVEGRIKGVEGDGEGEGENGGEGTVEGGEADVGDDGRDVWKVVVAGGEGRSALEVVERDGEGEGEVRRWGVREDGGEGGVVGMEVE